MRRSQHRHHRTEGGCTPFDQLVYVAQNTRGQHLKPALEYEFFALHVEEQEDDFSNLLVNDDVEILTIDEAPLEQNGLEALSMLRAVIQSAIEILLREFLRPHQPATETFARKARLDRVDASVREINVVGDRGHDDREPSGLDATRQQP